MEYRTQMKIQTKTTWHLFSGAKTLLDCTRWESATFRCLYCGCECGGGIENENLSIFLDS